ncbi:MAG: glycogen/starch/alpha-glucan phosphorylase [Candidatus Omnitrophica bacterium]|nr:glycogen/starch/alpha-glucan phosphorylase [Candidatus Omnitrophota bacterium]MDD5429362.1 glycogen/starch/alpha-glucan phosphorylase [Candidatus Omnitrophota bacterium]
MSQEGIERSFLSNRQYSLAKDQHSATIQDDFLALAITIRDRIIERWIATQQYYHKNNLKRVYYLSLEFLIGRLLGTNILNLGIWDEVKQAMENLGFDLEEIRECESDAGLGNGGLGRLAACFLDSMATLGIPAHGYGIRYDYGIFNQKIVNGYQVESPDKWLSKGNPWEFVRLEYTTKIKFYGHTEAFNDAEGSLRVKWTDTEDVLAVPYDIPVSGYKNNTVNTLRLWSAASCDEFDFKYFNDGDYEQAVYNKVFSENISKVLYPNDNLNQGKELRLKQEYFFTAASISDIIRRFKAENSDFNTLPDKAAIQLNDTHPVLAIVELMRILIDEESFDWESAFQVTQKTFSYTNHTVMPEALESWPVDMLERVLPRHLEIIYEINARFLKQVALRFPSDPGRSSRMSLFEEGKIKKIRMAYLAIIGSHSVNGVSQLHTHLIETQLFRDFYEMFPEKFNNKTNGISPRRWLYKSNSRLSDLITEAIGDRWIIDSYQLKKLLALKDKVEFQKKWQEVKRANKKTLAEYIYATTGIVVNSESLFDVQIKRIHEYKRQLLFGLFIVSQYLKIKHDPKSFVTPRTFIVSGKAAPGYFMAKLIIKFINSIADKVNSDKVVGDKLKVIFLENYRVSLAERIFPASELSEQISTAGTEASGTGCMKFMMNGALTIGTFDGANIEIAEEAGENNIFIFGLKFPEIKKISSENYDPAVYIKASPVLNEIIRLIQSGFFSPGQHNLFEAIVENLTHQDPYFICADFKDYCFVQEQVSREYRDSKSWIKKSIINVASSGKFSSDRTIKSYARDIWGVPAKGQTTISE